MPRNNDPTIGDDVVRWRAICKEWVESNPDGTETIQSWAFRHPTDEISANIASETTIDRFYERFPPVRFRTAEVTVGEARACGNMVCRDPIDDDASHVLICPTQAKSKNHKIKDAKRLAAKARLRPDGG